MFWEEIWIISNTVIVNKLLNEKKTQRSIVLLPKTSFDIKHMLWLT